MSSLLDVNPSLHWARPPRVSPGGVRAVSLCLNGMESPGQLQSPGFSFPGLPGKPKRLVERREEGGSKAGVPGSSLGTQGGRDG